MTTPSVEQVVAEVFGIPTEQVNGDTSPRTLEQWDSMKHIELIMTLEMQFDTQFAPADIPLLNSVGKIKQVLDVRA